MDEFENAANDRESLYTCESSATPSQSTQRRVRYTSYWPDPSMFPPKNVNPQRNTNHLSGIAELGGVKVFLLEGDSQPGPNQAAFFVPQAANLASIFHITPFFCLDDIFPFDFVDKNFLHQPPGNITTIAPPFSRTIFMQTGFFTQ